MKHQLTFHRRFGGELSLEQELIDLKRELPAWLRPLYGLALRWVLPWLRSLKVKSTMIDVDHQAAALADTQQEQDQRAALESAAAILREQHPGARVEIVSLEGGALQAIAIEHPPAQDDVAQQALGFGALEIRSPWTVQQDDNANSTESTS
jgi:hypothetical protein